MRINTLYEHAVSSHMKGAQQQTRWGSLYKRMTSYFLPVGALCFRVCFHAVGAKKRKGGGKIHCCIVMHFAAQRPVRLPTFLLKESSWQHALDEKHTSFLLGKSFAGITLLNRNVCVQASARVSATLFYEHPRDEVFVQYICKYRHTYTHWLYTYFCKHVDVEFLPQTAVNCNEELLVRPSITSLDLTSMGPGVWRSRMAQLPGGHFRLGKCGPPPFFWNIAPPKEEELCKFQTKWWWSVFLCFLFLGIFYAASWLMFNAGYLHHQRHQRPSNPATRPVVEPTVPIILWPKIIAFSKYIYICHIYMI